VVWNIPCDPNNTSTINGIPRNTDEGLLCYIVRALNLTTPSGFVTVDGVQTLTNKTLTAPVITNAGNSSFAGNVGIGTSSPSNKLDIQGAGSALRVIYNPDSGNTTPAAYIFQGVGLATHITNSLTLDPSGTQRATNPTGGGHSIDASGNQSFYNFSGATVGATTTTTNRLTIQSDGVINAAGNPITNVLRLTLLNSVVFLSGVGSPEGNVTAPIGSLYTNTSGGVSTTLYVKTSGAGNTGWTAK
jgi:hypothetical protein